MSDEITEGRVPQIGESVLWVEEEGDDWNTSIITEAGEINPDNGLYPVRTAEGPFTVYWSDEDSVWIHGEG